LNHGAYGTVEDKNTLLKEVGELLQSEPEFSWKKLTTKGRQPGKIQI